jgi:hypothetical protein
LLLLSAVAPVAAQLRPFTLGDRLTLSLAPTWIQRREVDLPPPPLMAASAPRFLFSDFLILENRHELMALKVGFSDNPFLGSDATKVDGQMHTPRRSDNLPAHLFYFFFPPPSGCLVQAKAAIERAENSQSEDDRKSRRTASVTHRCKFSPSPLDFYARRMSLGVRATSGGLAVPLDQEEFYLSPMEQTEIDGVTFYIFEARSRVSVDRQEIDFFNLPEDLRGHRVHFFWAFGAPTPFPFVRDPFRKNVEVVHVALGCLSSSGDASDVFREVLQKVRLAK